MVEHKIVKKKQSLIGKLYFCFLGVILILIGGCFIFFQARSYLKASETRQWPEVKCEIVFAEKAVRIVPNRSSEFQWQGKFSFAYEGEEWIGSKLEPRGARWTSKEEKVDELVETYAQGKELVCYVNPEDPEQAILKHDSLGAGYSIWFPGLFVIGGIGVIIGLFKKK